MNRLMKPRDEDRTRNDSYKQASVEKRRREYRTYYSILEDLTVCSFTISSAEIKLVRVRASGRQKEGSALFV